ncbi:Augmin subunit [Thalictrum thalictroides]|uniref:Augmin subunit n=1 Tax=Thalictrum thalictroides TaxID=46969 RepID=A0A7J6WR46_THATH|nr:Augmin subunit [Thalictrum thalictroides]
MVMDVYKVEQISCKEVTEETETTRPPLAPSEKNIVVPRRPKTTREVSSRYKAASSCPATPIVSRRCPSPNVARPIPATTSLFTKRAQSAERRRPSTPSSSPRPTTPLHDATPETQTHSKRLPGGRTSEGLWPSGTMRSLCVSFQSDTFSLPITKKEKPINHQSSLDHTLKTSANGVHRQAEATHAQRKMTPERRTTPLRGRNASDQLENSKPLDNSHVRAIDQHRWPSRTGSKVSTSPSIRSGNLTDKASKTFSSPLTGRGVSPLRRLPVSDVMGRGLQKAQSEVANRLSFDESGGVEHGLFTGDALRSFGIHKFSTPNVKSQSLPIPGSRPPSPSRTHMLSSSPARGSLSPSRARPSSPFPSASSVTSQSNSSSSVLSFIADYRKGKKGANHIEDAHQLRLLYNRYLQWRYANARADVTLSHQRIIAEKTLYNVWNTTSELWGSVTKKRINLQQLRQETKLTSTLNEQVKSLFHYCIFIASLPFTTVNWRLSPLYACFDICNCRGIYVLHLYLFGFISVLTRQ